MTDTRSKNNPNIKTYNAITDRTGRLVPNKCAGNPLITNDATNMTYTGLGFNNGVVRYKCMNNQHRSNSKPVMYNDFNVVNSYGSGNPDTSYFESIPPCRRCNGSCPWYWDRVTHQQKPRTHQGLYTIDGQYVIYKM